jgi:ketosteroid isomerase-like protein
MTIANSTATDEALIRDIVHGWANAIREKDSGALMSNFAPDALLFDLINPLQYVGADAGRKRAEQWLSAFQGLIEYELRDLTVSAGEGCLRLGEDAAGDCRPLRPHRVAAVRCGIRTSGRVCECC